VHPGTLRPDPRQGVGESVNGRPGPVDRLVHWTPGSRRIAGSGQDVGTVGTVGTVGQVCLCMSDEHNLFDGEAGDERLDDEAEVTCPYCGEIVAIQIDPAGGESQDYVQDCEVCCRPWHVQVRFVAGAAEVLVEPE